MSSISSLRVNGGVFKLHVRSIPIVGRLLTFFTFVMKF